MKDVPVLRTVAAPQALNEIESVLEHACTVIHDVPMNALMKLHIAVAEVIANIIEHATKGLSGLVHIEMGIRVLANEIRIWLTDDGNPVNPYCLATAMPDESAERGRGLAMARSVLSHLGYERTDDRNHWTLVSDRF